MFFHVNIERLTLATAKKCQSLFHSSHSPLILGNQFAERHYETQKGKYSLG